MSAIKFVDLVAQVSKTGFDPRLTLQHLSQSTQDQFHGLRSAVAVVHASRSLCAWMNRSRSVRSKYHARFILTTGIKPR
jgi:hypothetical protein